MHLAPTDEQQAFQRQARRFLAAEITRERRLEWDRTPEGHDAGVLEGGRRPRLVRLRAARSRSGGQGASLARPRAARSRSAAAPSRRSACSRASAAASRSTRSAPQAQRREWLPAHRARRAAGDARGRRARRGARAVGLHDRASRAAAKQLRLDGEKRFVLQGVTADAFLVAARDGAASRSCWCRATAPGVTRRCQLDARQGPAEHASASTASSLPSTALVRRARDACGPCSSSSGARWRRCSAAISSAAPTRCSR